MLQPINLTEIYLKPGDFYFGDADTRIRTILGSCISITMWHPSRLIGGMCHFLLPSRTKQTNSKLDGHYADEAMQMFLKEIKGTKTHPSEYRVKVFGGGNMLKHLKNSKADIVYSSTFEKQFLMDVASRNVLAAQSLLLENGFKLEAEDLGGSKHRHIIFDIWSGDVWVR